MDAVPFRVSLFGAPLVLYRDAPVTFPRRKALALLAYLAVADAPASRSEMALLLSPDQDRARANAELRRAWATLKEIGLSEILIADRETLALQKNPLLWIDTYAFEQALQEPVTVEALQRAVDLYRGDFLAGFSLRGSDTFYEWQVTQAQRLQRQFLGALDKLMRLYEEQQAYNDALKVVERVLSHDYFDENAQQQAMRLYAKTGQPLAALRVYEDYQRRLQDEIGANPRPETTQIYENIRLARTLDTGGVPVGSSIPLPPLVLGRESAFEDMKRLIRADDDAPSSPIVIQGWPGIGKTTFAAAFARRPDVQEAFPDGILWVALGQTPDIIVALQTCANTLGLPFVAGYESPEAIASRLAAVCHDRRMMLIVDDVWDVQDFVPFNFMGAKSVTLVTTRANSIAQGIALRPRNIYKLPILSEAQSLDLLNVLAPNVVRQNLAAVKALIEAVEGLPLALQVAGRLLRAESSLGWDVSDLLNELQAGTTLLNAQPPIDRTDMLQDTTPTVAALLKRSTDHLDEQTKIRFTLLGVFAPKPASFDLGALRAVWEVDDPKPTVRILVDRGLMEPIGGGEFQIHALLVAHARALFNQAV